MFILILLGRFSLSIFNAIIVFNLNMHLFFLKETKKWHSFLLWLCNSKHVVSVFYYACACTVHAKHLTLIFVFQNMAKTNAQRQKELRETKKEQPRRIPEERVKIGWMDTRERKTKLNSMQNTEMPLVDGEKARE